MADESERDDRIQGAQLARTWMNEAKALLNQAVGNVEASYVALEGGWTPQKRNVDCRLLLEMVLEARRHPDARRPPRLVELAIEFESKRTQETYRALLAHVTAATLRDPDSGDAGAAKSESEPEPEGSHSESGGDEPAD